MQENELKQKKDRNIIEIFFIIMVIILILFLIIEKMGKLNNFIPTGNVDIFDLHFGYDNNKDNNNTKDNIANDVNEKFVSNFKSGGNAQTNQVVIYDDDIVYKNNEAKIFKHSSFHIAHNKIAPTSKNSYKFIVRNGNEFNIKYNLVMSEENNHNINMRYRLKLRGKYIIGDSDNWVKAEELQRIGILLANNSYDTYTLDWCWFEGDNDTKVGENIEANYKLFIGMYAEQY